MKAGELRYRNGTFFTIWAQNERSSAPVKRGEDANTVFQLGRALFISAHSCRDAQQSVPKSVDGAATT